jgi:alanyl-tRNA synthetase
LLGQAFFYSWGIVLKPQREDAPYCTEVGVLLKPGGIDFMTETIYYKDIHQTEFDAEVVEIIKDKKTWKVILNKTCFYPEGGGQPADKGWINNIPVIDVRKEGGSIFHILTQNPGAGLVHGKIDTAHRYDFMQQHTGQHIISGAMWQVGKYKTVSVHMGTDYTTIETDAVEIPDEDLSAIETLANDIIGRDLHITAVVTREEELDQFPLRKPVARGGDIRLIRIGDFDCVGCGGLHLEYTREVQLVKAIDIEKIRGHVRIAWKIGKRAFIDYGEKTTIISDLKRLLETNPERFVQKTTLFLEELSSIKRKCGQMEFRLAEIMADQLYDRGRDISDSPFRVVTGSRKGEDDLLVKKILKTLLKRENLLVCLVNTVSGKLHWSIGCSENVDFSFEKIKEALLTVIGGKGGGRFPLWQGTGEYTEKADDFLSMFEKLLLMGSY